MTRHGSRSEIPRITPQQITGAVDAACGVAAGTTLDKVVASGPNARWPAWERLRVLLHFGEGARDQAVIGSTLDVVERQVVREDGRSADGLRALVARHVIDALAH
jgi:hypothetical protein